MVIKMTKEQFEMAKELFELIEVTEAAMENLREIEPAERGLQRIYDDRIFYLSISKHSDGSGNTASLNRYFGNKELLETIINTLERQLDEYKDKLESL